MRALKSYKGQILTLTYSLIGKYSVPPYELELGVLGKYSYLGDISDLHLAIFSVESTVRIYM